MTLRIDCLGPLEGPRLREVRLRALHDAPDAFGDTAAAALGRGAEEWSGMVVNLPTFVAVVDDADVGMVRCCGDASDPLTAWLLSMWVAPAARGLGIGDRLVDEVIGWARARGCRRVLLEVANENGAAIGLYARKGFAPNGATGSLPPPRDHILEHQRELTLENRA
jgi:ribosomal protein S18 acetylase RimI-like enzyme